MAKKPRTAADILRAARKLIDAPKKWTQGANGRDEDGNDVMDDMAFAVCFCGAGAVFAVAQRTPCLSFKVRCEADVWLSKAAGGCWAEWQDAPGRRHSTMLRRFDRAIALADAANNTKAGE